MTIKDIAQAAGVSAATVSKVINRKDKDISDATRKKVLAVIEEYQYRPYMEAVREQSGRSRLVAVLAEREDEYQRALLTELAPALARLGYSVLFSLYEERLAQLKQAQILCHQRLEALVVLTRRDISAVRQVMAGHDIPVIGLTESPEPRRMEINDGLGAAAESLAAHLAGLGHTKIACLTGGKARGWPEGYKRALSKRRLHFESIHDASVLASPLESWLAPETSAVICEDVSLAAALCRSLLSQGSKVPEDMSVAALVGGALAAQLYPSLTTVALPFDAIAERLAARAVTAIEGRPRTDTLPFLSYKIEPRESTAAPHPSRHGQKLVVVGSLNMDVNISTPRIPVAGENLQASSVARIPGGKGANQAIGAARLGADVYLLGCVGQDAAARDLRAGLMQENVHLEGLRTESLLDTGRAYINVDDKGSSTIVIYPGANSYTTAKWLEGQRDLFRAARYALISTEIPFEGVERALTLASEFGVPTILKPAGLTSFPAELYPQIDFLVANRHELRMLVPGEESLEEKAASLQRAGCKNVIVTLGAGGCYLLPQEGEGRRFPAMAVTPVDTTGGADAFISALAVYLSEGTSLTRAIGFATYSAGICVSGKGVQPALAHRDELDAHRDEIGKIFYGRNDK